MLVVQLVFVNGCGEGKAIELRYERPAQYDISRRIKRVGITEFGAVSPQDKQWAQVASDRLAAALDTYNRKYQRYELVDRQRLQAILGERDLQLAISDTSSATRVGKLANVDAMVYGNVKVSTHDESGTRTTFNPLRGKSEAVPYVRRSCVVNVNFTMDDISTGKTLAVVASKMAYDSEDDSSKSTGAKLIKAMKFSGGSDLPPTDEVVSGLIDACVEEFISKISPHDVTVKIKLQRGKSEVVGTGNKLAAAGEYTEALECYQRGIELNGQDHGAIFNAGAMHEAKGDLVKAAEFYNRAFEIEPKEQYILARKRVRTEGENNKVDRD